jgi:hypothetical protein
MSQFYEYNWPAPVVNGISLAQSIISNTPLLLNGYYVNKTTGTVNFVGDFGIVPNITFTSTDDLSNINFLITGYQNGILINETLVGPNNTTVTSVNCFDTVTQIVPNNTTTNTVQVGVASIGYFPIILLNTAKQNVSTLNYAINVISATSNPATYQIFLSLKNNLGTGTYNSLINNGNFFALGSSSTVSTVTPVYYLPAQNLLIQINPNNNGSTLTAQFLQL